MKGQSKKLVLKTIMLAIASVFFALGFLFLPTPTTQSAQANSIGQYVVVGNKTYVMSSLTQANNQNNTPAGQLTNNNLSANTFNALPNSIVALTAISSPITFDESGNLSIIFASSSVSSLAAFNLQESQIASKLTATKTNSQIEITITNNQTVTISTSHNASYTLGSMALGANAVLNCSNGIFTVGAYNNFSSFMATQSQEAKLLHLQSGEFNFNNSSYKTTGSGRAFYVSGGTLSLNGVTLDGFNSSANGGAIYCSGTNTQSANLVLNNTTIKNCSANNGAAAYVGDYASLGLGTPTFTNNTSTSYGEDIYIGSSVINLTGDISSPVKLYKSGITSIDQTDTVTSHIATTTISEYLQSAKNNISVVNYASYHQNSSTTKTNYLVCEYKSYTATFTDAANVVYGTITAKYNAALGTLPYAHKTGYILQSWNSSANGSGATITDTTTMPEGGANYYAIWKLAIVTLNKNWKSSVTTANVGITTSNINSIKFANEIPSGYTQMGTTNFAETTSDEPLYMFGTLASGSTTLYDICFVSAGKINLPTNSSSLFSSLSAVTSIDFTNCFADNVTSMQSMFSYCSSLTSLDLSNFNTANVTNMSYMFNNCSGLTSLDLNNFNTANVTNMSYMFSYCSGLTSLDVSSFNTQNVTTMQQMFSNCRALTSLDLSNFNTANVTNMGSMFDKCSSLTSLDLSSFNTQSVTNMVGMFSSCSSLTSLDVSNFDTSKVTSMQNLFISCKALTSLDLSNFNTASVTNMSGMFSNCSALTSLVVSNFNTSSVTNMGSMFTYCSGLTSLDVSNFNTSRVTNMDSMFYRCSSLTSLDVSSFNTTNVTNMHAMFYECSSITSLDVSDFNTSNVTDMYGMFSNCSSLISLDVSNFNTANVTNMGSMFYKCSSLTSLDLSSFNTQNVTRMSYMFYKCSGLTSLDVSSFNTTSVTTMYQMFYECGSLTSLDVSDFNTSNVTDMHAMFYNCSSLTSLDVSNFNTANVTDMEYMFVDCIGLTSLDVSNFNTASVTNMGSMFSGCEKLTSLDVSNFNTSSVTDMSSMFSNCSSLTSLNLSSFNTSSVTDMRSMFNTCENLTSLDLSNFDTSSVTDMAYMFSGCVGLTSLNVSSFVTPNVTSMYWMFYGCFNLTSLDLSGFTLSSNCKTDAMFGALVNSFETLVAPSSIASNHSIDLTKTMYYFGATTIENTTVLNTACQGTTLYAAEEDVVHPAGLYQSEHVIIYRWQELLDLGKITVTNGALKGNDSTMAGRLVIDDSVTSIAMNGFSSYTGLTSVSFPEGLITIGGLAFKDCTNLSGNLILPSTLKTIEKRAFQECSKLTGELRLPSGLTCLERSAFQNCSGFTGSLVIPDGITEIGIYTFLNCKGLNGTLTLPNGLISVGDYAFDVAKFTGELILPNTLTTIGTYAFSGVDCVGTLVLPDSVTSLGEYAFYGCNGFTGLKLSKNLTNLQLCAFALSNNFAGDLVIPEGLTTIGNNVFRYNKFTNVYFPSTITSIGQYAFSESSLAVLYDFTACTSIPTIGIGEFDGAGKAFKIHVPSYLYNDWVAATNWSTWADYIVAVEVPGLYNQTTGDIIYTWKQLLSNNKITVTNGALKGNDSTMAGRLVIDDSVTSIASYGFQNYTGLTSLVIPNSVVSIGVSAFNRCRGLTGNLVIPNSVTTLDEAAFANCSGISGELILSENLTSIGTSIFAYCNEITSVIIPDSVTSIGTTAFYDCVGLVSVTLGSGLTSIANNSFNSCYRIVEVYNRSSLNITKGSTSNGNVAKNAINIYTPSSGQSYLSTDENGYIIYNDGTNVILASYVGNQTELILPSNLTQINKYAFYNETKITSVTIGSAVTTIGNAIFAYCNNLTSINIDSANTTYHSSGNCIIKTSTNSLIAGCKTSVIPNYVTEIFNHGFGYCSSLTSITIPNSVKTINYGAFYYCQGLTSLSIPSSVTNIVGDAFRHCENILSYDFTNHTSVPTLGTEAFQYINRNCKIYVPASLYNTWVAATNWSTWADYIVAADSTSSASLYIADNNDRSVAQLANLNLSANTKVVCLPTKQEEDGDQPEAILNKDDYDTDTPPVVNQTTSV